MAAGKYQQVHGYHFFDLIDKKAKKLHTHISETGRFVAYIDKKSNVVAGYIVTKFDDVRKYYINSEYEFVAKKS